MTHGVIANSDMEVVVPKVKGQKNRNYPNPTITQALKVPRAIQEKASGMPVNKLTLAEIVDMSPGSGSFRDLLLASRAYGLTTGGVNADRFELTALGNEATGADEAARLDAMRKAIMNIEPFRTFLTSYSGKKIPATSAFKDFLVQNAAVPSERAEDCIAHVLTDAREARLVKVVKGGAEYVELDGVPLNNERTEIEDATQEREYERERDEEEIPVDAVTSARSERGDEERRDKQTALKKVFIAHRKNRIPLEQLKKMLGQFKVDYAVAVDEPNRGRPISTKVANLMRDECSSAIFIFTADERFLQEEKDGNTIEVWRPSENVIYELGAASILYDRRIVIFKEKRVTFPSDFSDLGYIEFETDQLVVQMGNLFSELVALDILEVRAKS